MTDTGPLFVSSGDLIADRRYKWALDHAARGDLAGAATNYEDYLKTLPNGPHAKKAKETLEKVKAKIAKE